MQLTPFAAQHLPLFLQMSADMYDSPAVAHPVSEDVFRATFAACLAKDQNIEGFWVEEEGKPCGYLLLVHAFSSEVGAPIIMVEELYLLPEARGHHTGRAVLELLSAQYRGKVGALKLECTPENVGAMHLYRTLGFEPLPYTAMLLTL